MTLEAMLRLGAFRALVSDCLDLQLKLRLSLTEERGDQ